MNPQVKEISKADARIVCQYCQRSEVNSLEWGPMYQLAGVSIHYFCLLFSSGLSQNGEDDEGILGFLPIDIRKELKRGDKLKCKFCKHPRATIGCSVKNCKRSYHFPCGLNKGCVFQFMGNFESYCSQHKEVVTIPLPKEEWDCPICFSPVEDEDLPLWPPCCKKRVFHKRCIMEMAKTAGAHFFKCPLCNDKDLFAKAMKKSGVYLPDRDAEWETAPNAFAEHTRLYSRCDANSCECPKGRDYSSKSDSRPWKIIRCGACGAHAIHKRCGNLQNLTWRCPLCADVLSDKRRNESMNSSRIQRHHYDLSSDEEIENDTPITGIKEAIIEAPQVENSSPSSNDSSSEEDVRKVTTIYDARYRRHIVMDDSSSDEDSEESGDSGPEEEVYIQASSKLGQKLQLVSREIEGKAQGMTGGITRNVLQNMNEIRRAVFCTQEKRGIVSKLKSNVVGSSKVLHEDENWRTVRSSTFDTKLQNTVVQCCRQNSSSGNNIDNVSDPVRPENVAAVPFPAIGRDQLINVSTKKVLGQVELTPKPEVVSSESPSRSVKISLKCATSGANSTLLNLKKPVVDEDDAKREGPPSVDNDDIVEVDKPPDVKHEETCIILDDDDDSSSDIEIVNEKIKPEPCTKSSAFLDMVNKARGNKPAPTAPIVRLGVDDDQIDDIEFVETINRPKPAITFSSFSKSAVALPSISSAFLRVIHDSKESSKSHCSGRLSSVVHSRYNEKSGPDIETVELISDDDEPVQSSFRVNKGDSYAKKCSKKRDRLSPSNQTLSSGSSAHLSKRQRN